MTYPNSDYYVHEFSRQLIDTSKKDGRWVSGGFGKEVGESEFPIPEQIKQAVNQGEFRINDNYPPADGEHALIAKEIDDYSVLAVATREFDDKGNRNLVAYRYFWLKRTIKDMDGVGTLLEWWINQGEPKFEFEQSTQTSLNYLPQYYYPIERFEAYLQPQQLEKFITEVKFSPYVCKDKCQHRVLHALALQLHQKYANTPVAWAWNVRLLEKSASYNLTLIYCADDTAYKYISEDVKSKLKQLIPIPEPTSIPSQNQGEEVNYLNINRQRSHSVLQLGELAPSTSTEPHQQPGDTSTEQYQQPGATSTGQYQQPGATSTGQYQQPGDTSTEQYQQPGATSTEQYQQPGATGTRHTGRANPSFWSNLRLSLLTSARNIDDQNLVRLADYLEQRISNKWAWEWEQVVDLKMLNTDPPNDSVARYWALLTILGYEQVINWFSEFKNYSSGNKTAALNVQFSLLEICSNRTNKQVETQLEYFIFKGISKLLYKYRSLSPSESPTIQKLLLSPRSIWSHYFREYLKQIVVQLTRRDENEGSDDFYQELLVIVQHYDLPNNPQAQYKRPEYKALAELMIKAQNHTLSAFFYQLSDGRVPAKIYGLADLEIIPLRCNERKFKEKNWLRPQLDRPFFLIGGISFLFIIIAILGGLLALRNGISPPFSKSLPPQSNANENRETTNREFSKNFQIWEKNQDAKNHIKEDMKSLINYLKNSRDEKPERYDEIYDFIKNEFVPKLSLKFNNLGKKQIKQGSSPEDIKVVQTVLKTQYNYDVQINGQFDQNTIYAIEQIQTTNNLKTNGVVDAKTWQTLTQSPQFVDGQVRIAAEFLHISFEQSKDNQQIKQDIQKLKDCQNKKVNLYNGDFVSFSCLNRVLAKEKTN